MDEFVIGSLIYPPFMMFILVAFSMGLEPVKFTSETIAFLFMVNSFRSFYMVFLIGVFITMGLVSLPFINSL